MDSNDKLEVLKRFEPTDAEIERLAAFEKPAWAKRDFNSQAVAAVVLDDEDPRGASMNAPHAYEGGVTFTWKDSVLFSVGAGAQSVAEARVQVERSRIMAVDGLKKEQKRKRQIERYYAAETSEEPPGA